MEQPGKYGRRDRSEDYFGMELLHQGPVPEPHLTVDTAIRYATDLRASAKDAAVRTNAALKRFR